MTDLQIAIVQTTWKTLLPRAEEVVSEFFDRLFQANPELRSMFKENMAPQYQQLSAAIATTVQGLDDLEALKPALRELGRRHVVYGVKSQHYQAVGTALITTLEESLGDSFTDESKRAWADFYDSLAQAMQTDPSTNVRVISAPGPRHASCS